MKGSTYKRCACRDTDGKPLDRDCLKLQRAKHGSWFYDVRVEGKRYRRGGFGRQQDAQAALDLLRKRLGDGEDVTIRSSVGEWLDEWLAAKRNLRGSTRKSYGEHVRLYLRPHLGDVQLEKLRPAHIAAMYTAIEQANAEREREVGPATIRRIHATLRSALNAATKQRRMPYNPALHVELPEASRPKVQPWSVDELGAFLDAAASDRLGALYEVMAFTGLRRGEAIGLRWVDVDVAGAVLFVRQQITDFGVGKPKTRDSEGRVDLDDTTVGTLIAHQLRQQNERDQWGDAYQDNGLVFCREDGAALRPEYATRHMQRIAETAGLPRKRLHDLRHGSASLQIAAGVDLAIVSKRLRHSSVAITADTYTHLLEGVGHDAAERARALVPRARGPIPAPSGAGDAAAVSSGATKPQVKRGGPPRDRTENPRIKRAGTHLSGGVA